MSTRPVEFGLFLLPAADDYQQLTELTTYAESAGWTICPHCTATSASTPSSSGRPRVIR